MDVFYFLKERTRLIRQYYETASLPFSDIIRKIEMKEEPYVVIYCEDREPPFLTEWIEANELLEVTGRCCLSMLSASLQLYLNTWDKILGLQCKKQFKAGFKQAGLMGGYNLCLADRLGVDWNTCPADMAIIEQVILARNRDQHPDSVTSFGITHAQHDLARYPSPFFLKDNEPGGSDDGSVIDLWMPRALHVPKDKLMAAIANVEILCEWLEESMLNAKYPSRHTNV